MEHIYLSGSEEVSRAASSMRSAAEEMNRAAANIEGSLWRHCQFLDDWLIRFESILSAHAQTEKT